MWQILAELCGVDCLVVDQNRSRSVNGELCDLAVEAERVLPVGDAAVDEAVFDDVFVVDGCALVVRFLDVAVDVELVARRARVVSLDENDVLENVIEIGGIDGFAVDADFRLSVDGQAFDFARKPPGVAVVRDGAFGVGAGNGRALVDCRILVSTRFDLVADDELVARRASRSVTVEETTFGRSWSSSMSSSASFPLSGEPLAAPAAASSAEVGTPRGIERSANSRRSSG